MIIMNSFIKYFLVSIYAIIVLSIMTGCKTTHIPTTTIRTLNLQQAEVTGPINQPPIHITDSIDAPSITITPRFSYNSQTDIRGEIGGHTLVNEEGIFQVDTFYNYGSFTLKETPGANIHRYSGKNFTWNVASVYAALDLDFRLSTNFGLFFGVNYSEQNKINTLGGTAGIGIFGASSNTAFRLDFGVNIQEIAYDIYSVLIVKTTPSSGEDDYVIVGNRIGNSTHFDPFISLTYNTTFRDWFVNFFLNVGYSRQTLIDFKSESSSEKSRSGDRYITRDFRGESIAGFFHFTPGIYFFVGESGRILFGARFFYQTMDDSTEPSKFILPMVQFDFTL
jgi:hypothetical protein